MQKFLYYPVKPFYVNQGFGVNAAYYAANYGIKAHNGLDLQAYHGQPVYAPCDGYAYFESDDAGGEGVVVVTKDLFDYNGTECRFKIILWHFCDGTKEPQFKSPIIATNVNGDGQFVKSGDLVGYADNTGKSTGDHVHLGLKPVTPQESSINGSMMTIGKDNGYAGAIDPTPYLTGLYAGDISAKYHFTANFGKYSLRFTDVYNLQKILVSGGFGDFSPTGFYGTLTEAAVKKYQVAHGIEGTGFVGPITRASINN